MKRWRNEKGSLTVVLMYTLFVTMLAGFALTLALNQKRLTDAAAGRRMVAYYRARAGVIDAFWLIRTNPMNGSQKTVINAGAIVLISTRTPSGAQNFSNPDWDPDPYYLDLDGNTASLSERTVDDVKVDIGYIDGNTGLRAVESEGLDK